MTIDDEYMARLRAMVDGLPNVDLDRLGRCDGPRIYVQLDDDGLPINGVVYLPATNQVVMVRLPEIVRATPAFDSGCDRRRVRRLDGERLA